LQVRTHISSSCSCYYSKGSSGRVLILRLDTEKPIELMRILFIKRKRNRQYIGVELDENYFKIAEERIKKVWEEKRKEKDLQAGTLFGDEM